MSYIFRLVPLGETSDEAKAEVVVPDARPILPDAVNTPAEPDTLKPHSLDVVRLCW